MNIYIYDLAAKHQEKWDLDDEEMVDRLLDFIEECGEDVAHSFKMFLDTYTNSGYAACGCDCEECLDGRCGEGDCECAYK